MPRAGPAATARRDEPWAVRWGSRAPVHVDRGIFAATRGRVFLPARQLGRGYPRLAIRRGLGRKRTSCAAGAVGRGEREKATPGRERGCPCAGCCRRLVAGRVGI